MTFLPPRIRARFATFFNPTPDEAKLPRRMFWVALTVRVLYLTLAHTYRIRIAGDHFQFGWEMGRIARALVLGHGYADPFNGPSGPTAWTPPLYTLLLAGVFKLFGVYSAGSAWVILALNSVFSAATAPAVYELAWRCFGRSVQGLRIALWSGWLWALYPAAMQYAVHWVWDMALTAMLFTWVLVLVLRIFSVGAGSATRLWVGFGLLWGLIGMSNSSLLVCLPVCGLWLLWSVRRRPSGWRTLAANVVLSAVCFGAVLAPWIVRNSLTFHAFVPLRANFGAELYESVKVENNGFPWGTSPIADGGEDLARYKQLGELRYSKEQGERARAVIAAHPGVFWRHALVRVYFFWISVPKAVDLRNLGAVAVEVVREINYAWLSVGALLGLALALRHQVPGAWLFLAIFACQPLLYYFITVQARFRHPLEPVMTILLVYLFHSATPRGVRRIEV